MWIIKKLIYPPACVGCGEIMNIFSPAYNDSDAYCPSCRAEWERAKVSQCAVCGMANLDCSCVPELLKNEKIVSIVKFGHVQAVDRLVFALKRSKNKRVFGFITKELAHRLFLYMREYKKEISETVITYVPRNPSSVAVYGHDHAKMLARGVSEILNIGLASSLKRKRGGAAQKKLTAEERLNNAGGRFVLREGADEKLRGKTVVLVDDVVTSGATCAACIEHLKKCEPENIVILSIAKRNADPKRKNSQSRVRAERRS